MTRSVTMWLGVITLLVACGGAPPRSVPPVTATGSEPDRQDTTELSAPSAQTRASAGGPQPQNAEPGTPRGTSTPPPAPATRPVAIPVTPLERHRIGGITKFLPDAETKVAMTRAGQKHIITTIKFCNSVKGVMYSAEVIQSSGYPSYDEVIRSTMLKTWRYRPFMVDGAAVSVCTSQTFIYMHRP